MNTPYYLFTASKFRERIDLIKSVFPDMDLTFSVKANPFLLSALPDRDTIRYVEVCSPGELSLCRASELPGDRILYSGVMKEESDIREAIAYGASILTAESRRHYDLIAAECDRSGKTAKVILRLSSGNQFGMSGQIILDILSEKDRDNIEVTGIHYYSGTAKSRLKQIEKDLKNLTSLLEEAKSRASFVPTLVEYGPGLSSEYYESPYEERDAELIKLVSEPIREFGKRYRTGLEMGRFMAAPSGSYFTSVMDIKLNGDVNYVICDGGVHQLKYHGQNMAMKVPPLSLFRDGEEIWSTEGSGNGADTETGSLNGSKHYCICGSLCTTADVLVRDISLPELLIGDVLCFGRCGAYSVTEGPIAFLSRKLPEIWLRDGETRLLREGKESWKINRETK
ncbi:MAG: alanine racemase [Lachnospiraceae bacterium]|nr:alanine racemase [Lachnospiraceae bacterium]